MKKHNGNFNKLTLWSNISAFMIKKNTKCKTLTWKNVRFEVRKIIINFTHKTKSDTHFRTIFFNKCTTHYAIKSIVLKLRSVIDVVGVLSHWVNGRTTESLVEPHEKIRLNRLTRLCHSVFIMKISYYNARLCSPKKIITLKKSQKINIISRVHFSNLIHWLWYNYQSNTKINFKHKNDFHKKNCAIFILDKRNMLLITTIFTSKCIVFVLKIFVYNLRNNFLIYH